VIDVPAPPSRENALCVNAAAAFWFGYAWFPIFLEPLSLVHGRFYGRANVKPSVHRLPIIRRDDRMTWHESSRHGNSSTLAIDRAAITAMAAA
jgi:hypothetical protein